MLDTIPRHLLTDATHLHLPSDPYAEGQRARAAGLAEGENPYLWPPGAGAEWVAGWRGIGR